MSNWRDVTAFGREGFRLTLGEAVDHWRRQGLLVHLLLSAAADKLVRDSARTAGVTVSAEELQTAADRRRTALGLHSADATAEWLRRHGMTLDDLEADLESELFAEKLTEGVPPVSVQAFFARTRQAFDRAHLWRITVASEGAAHELLVRIVEEGADFAELARLHSLDREARSTGGDLGAVARHELPADIADVVFSAGPGDVVGPLAADGGVHLYRVTALVPAELDDAIAGVVRRQVFESRLADRMNELGLSAALVDGLR